MKSFIFIFIVVMLVLAYLVLSKKRMQRNIREERNGIKEAIRSTQESSQIIEDTKIFWRYWNEMQYREIVTNKERIDSLVPMWLLVLKWKYIIYDIETARYSGDMATVLEKEYLAWKELNNQCLQDTINSNLITEKEMKKSIEEKMELELLEKQKNMFQNTFSSRTNKEGLNDKTIIGSIKPDVSILSAKKQTNNVKNRARYILLKERIRKLLKAELIKETKIVTGKGASPTIILRNDKEIVYRGKISLPLHKYIFKKEYSDKKE